MVSLCGRGFDSLHFHNPTVYFVADSQWVSGFFVHRVPWIAALPVGSSEESVAVDIGALWPGAKAVHIVSRWMASSHQRLWRYYYAKWIKNKGWNADFCRNVCYIRQYFLFLHPIKFNYGKEYIAIWLKDFWISWMLRRWISWQQRTSPAILSRLAIVA